MTKRAVIDFVIVEYDVCQPDDKSLHYPIDKYRYLGKGYFAQDFLLELWIANGKDPSKFRSTQQSLTRFYLEKNKSTHTT